MKGNRLDKTPDALPNPGDYWKSDNGKYWFCCTPDGRVGNLARHDVTEHDDGTITVSPSILVSGGGSDGNWHGYLEHGVWRSC